MPTKIELIEGYKQEIVRLQRILSFYADKANYRRGSFYPDGTEGISPIERDNGTRAREGIW